ncbi:MAG: HD domain-containing protein [Acidobacteria bacterium]|nr:HD domain-containing protein [Acidobacteriota bacterium]
MYTPEPPLKFPPHEQSIAERLMRIIPEIDRIEGYEQPHAVAVARLAEILALQLGLRGQDLSALLLAALAHDLGERAMKRTYLLREDALTWEETLDLWRHPILGEQQSGEFNLPRQAQLFIRWHHESWNGEGYPDALTGESIPLGARILRVADTWCALTADRPYRQGFDPLEAEEIIAGQAGIELDPIVVQVLLEHLQSEREAEVSAESEDQLGATLPIEVQDEEPVFEGFTSLAGESVVPITEDPAEDPISVSPGFLPHSTGSPVDSSQLPADQTVVADPAEPSS